MVANGAELLALVQAKVGNLVTEGSVDRGDAVVRVDRAKVEDLARILKLDAELRFDMLLSVTAVDWLDQRPERFELVYHLLSIPLRRRIRVKANVPEAAPEAVSLTGLYAAANFLEREVFDMYGIRFTNHPDLRRILMYDEFVGHPLRKDYPLRAKQPRILLRAPEVRNTALDMTRPELVSIGGRRGGAVAETGKDR